MSRGIMIDLETLGDTPGCSIIAIGAVAFVNDGCILDRFYRVVSRESCRSYGLREDQSTLDWWSRQSEEARQIIARSEAPDANSLPEALESLNAFIVQHGQHSVEVYGNGSDFDNAILATAARAAHIELAWPFWRNRCYRTLKSLAPGVRLKREGLHHNALDDAASQAKHLGQINWALALTSDKVDRAAQFIDWMALAFIRRTSLRFLGLRIPSMSWAAAQQYAKATFDANALEMPFGHPDYGWSEDDADELVAEEMQHWEAA